MNISNRLVAQALVIALGNAGSMRRRDDGLVCAWAGRRRVMVTWLGCGRERLCSGWRARHSRTRRTWDEPQKWLRFRRCHRAWLFLRRTFWHGIREQYLWWYAVCGYGRNHWRQCGHLRFLVFMVTPSRRENEGIWDGNKRKSRGDQCVAVGKVRHNTIVSMSHVDHEIDRTAARDAAGKTGRSRCLNPDEGHGQVQSGIRLRCQFDW